MKKLFFFFFCLAGMLQLSAQTYRTEFTYDMAGNRTSRKVINLSAVQSKSLLESEEEVSPLQEEWEERKITIYPNPTQGKLLIRLSGGKEEEVHGIYLFSSSGNLIAREQFTGSGEYTADLSGHPDGIYILHIRTGEDEKQYKIIKQ